MQPAASAHVVAVTICSASTSAKSKIKVRVRQLCKSTDGTVRPNQHLLTDVQRKCLRVRHDSEVGATRLDVTPQVPHVSAG